MPDRKNVLVTGGGGYIGAVMCECLLDAGHDVVCLDRFFFGRQTVRNLVDRQGFSVVQTDVRSCDPGVLSGVDVVMDLAGISNDPSCDLDPKLTEDINLSACVRMAKLASEAGVSRYIFSSSCSIYGAGASDALTEESPLNPVSLYANLKIQAEKALLELASDQFCVVLMRNSTAYGYSPRMRLDLLVNMMTAHAVTRHKIFILGGGKQRRPNVHICDIAKAFILAMDAPESDVNGEAFNVGSNAQNYQVAQMARMISEIVPFTELEVVPEDADRRDYHVNFDKIRAVLGFEPEHTPEDAVREIKQAIETGEVNCDDVRTSTLKYYQYLIEAERVLKDVMLDGRLF